MTLQIGKEVVNKHGYHQFSVVKYKFVFSNTCRHLIQCWSRVKITKVFKIAKFIAYQGSFVITATIGNIKKLYFCSPIKPKIYHTYKKYIPSIWIHLKALFLVYRNLSCIDNKIANFINNLFYNMKFLIFIKRKNIWEILVP